MAAMSNSDLTKTLNEQQYLAVTADPSNLLILAGAGSGKTRVLVHRMAWLIEHFHVPSHSILAVTFTNKAAHEMRGRVESLLGHSMRHMWIGTFHGLAHRLLRLHYQEAGLSEGFQIIDSDDQLRLIRRIQKQLNIDEKKWPPKQAQWFINKEKEAGRRPHQVVDYDHSYFIDTMLSIYKTYENMCRQSNLVDFSELLLRSLELLQNQPQIADHYQRRFRHILVDEFQDTNKIQYDWLKTLKADDNYLIAVGDDDQSIYSWRGACIENIHRFSQELPDVMTINLEQNYRSTQNILSLANAVISKNQNRFSKELWSQGEAGALISLYQAFNERDEAYYITNLIQQWLREGRLAKEVAILYRSNAQSRVLEEQLIDKQIPYRIYGGLKFFERAEIKDAVAYLRLITNRLDDPAFERIVNTPTRGIGESTLNVLRIMARDNSTSLWQAAEFLLANAKLPARAASALAQFIQLINKLADSRAVPLGEFTDIVIEQSGLLDLYKKDKNEKGLSRVENLAELVNAATQFKPEDDNLPLLEQFLAHIALETGDDQADAHTDCVSLMTLHAAKGLEFPLVFISGMEQGLFPHKMALEEANGLEEERRLCYVGITRAMEKLVLTYAECRQLHGTERFSEPSRFISELPEELIQHERVRAKVSRPKAEMPNYEIEDSGYRIGQHVKHKTFGTGVIINYEGKGDNTRLQVKFDLHGSKWLVASFANLEVI